MSQDPVDIAELRHDIESSKRLAEQDRLETEFKRDPDWDLVAEHLIERETMADLIEIIGGRFVERYPEKQIIEGYENYCRVRRIVRLAIEQCAREYAEREAGK